MPNGNADKLLQGVGGDSYCQPRWMNNITPFNPAQPQGSAWQNQFPSIANGTWSNQPASPNNPYSLSNGSTAASNKPAEKPGTSANDYQARPAEKPAPGAASSSNKPVEK